MRQTKSLSSPRFPCAMGLCRLSPAPAGRWPFPTLSLQPLCRCLDPYPAVSPRCLCPFLPWERRPHATGNAFGTRNCPCPATSTGSRISGLQSFGHFRLLHSLGLQVAPTAKHTARGGQAVYTTHSPEWLPLPGCGITTRPLRATDAAGLAPAGLQPCRLLLPT